MTAGHTVPLRCADFDAIAPSYGLLERLAFGAALQRARVTFIDEARRARRILLVGEGNGRFLAELVRINAAAEIDSLDASAVMLRLAREQVCGGRVQFHHANIFKWRPQRGDFDLIVTNFFLDCFDYAQLAAVVDRISSLAAPRARWLISDFNLPQRGLARVHAKMWLVAMYHFFRRVAALPARELAPFSPFLRETGWLLRDQRDSRFGLISAQLWERVR